MIQTNGRIAFISSATVFLPFPIALAYASSKAALDGFAHALEAYTVKHGITVTRVYPGPMKTDHIRYYPGHANTGLTPAKILPAIVRGIRQRKRQVYPDMNSRLFKLASLIMPSVLPRLCHYIFISKKRKTVKST